MVKDHTKESGTGSHTRKEKFSRQHDLKPQIKKFVVVGLIGSFLFVIIATSALVNTSQMAQNTRASSIDDTTKQFLQNINYQNECTTDDQCEDGLVCRTNPEIGIKQCLLCQVQECPAPARTVKYGQLYTSQSRSQPHTSPLCEANTQTNAIDAWCRSSNITVRFEVKLRNTGSSGDIQYYQNDNKANLLLLRYSEGFFQDPKQVSAQRIEVSMTQLLNNDANTSYHFETVLNTDDIENNRANFKIWLQLPPYKNKKGNTYEGSWITSHMIELDEKTLRDEYTITLEY